MSPRIQYEQSILDDVVSVATLALGDFVALPAYVEGRSSYDTWYDGHVVRVEVFGPTLADSGVLVLDILGPYWDRVYRCRFEDATDLSLSGVNLLSFPEVHQIALVPAADGQECTFRTYNPGQELSVRFRRATVERRMLRTPIKREPVTS